MTPTDPSRAHPGSLRRALDGLYAAASWLAALCMVATLAMVLGSVVDRYVSLPLRGMDMYAGYSMAGAGFLALAGTLKSGEHIRVTLLLSALQPRPRRALEMACLVAALLISGAFAVYAIRLVLTSYAFHDVSTGNDATPLWIPQSAMAAGAVVLFVAFVDEFVSELLGRRTNERVDEIAHVE